MRSQFTCPPSPPTEQLRYEVEQAFRRVDRILTIERRTIGTTETKVAHGFPGVPRWRPFNQEGPGDVYQTRAPDNEFLYLEATPSDVVVSLELF